MQSYSVKMRQVRWLQRQLDEGIFAIPRLQREFVWNGRKAVALLDSMYKGMPIGTILVWDTGRENQALLRKALNVLPAHNSASKRIWFLVDGQQRLSVLYQAEKGEEKPGFGGRLVDFSRLTFRVENSGESGDEQLFQYRLPIEGRYIAVPHPEILA